MNDHDTTLVACSACGRGVVPGTRCMCGQEWRGEAPMRDSDVAVVREFLEQIARGEYYSMVTDEFANDQSAPVLAALSRIEARLTSAEAVVRKVSDWDEARHTYVELEPAAAQLDLLADTFAAYRTHADVLRLCVGRLRAVRPAPADKQVLDSVIEILDDEAALSRLPDKGSGEPFERRGPDA